MVSLLLSEDVRGFTTHILRDGGIYMIAIQDREALPLMDRMAVIDEEVSFGDARLTHNLLIGFVKEAFGEIEVMESWGEFKDAFEDYALIDHDAAKREEEEILATLPMFGVF